MCLSVWICSNQVMDLQKGRQEKQGHELGHHCATLRLLQPLRKRWPDVPPDPSLLVNEASFWSTASLSTQVFATYFWKCTNFGPRTSLWLLGKNTVSKPAILAGKNTAWGEAGGSGVQGGRGGGVWVGPMEDKDGKYWKRLGQSCLILAQNPSTSASDGTSAADRGSLCVLFSWLLVCKRLGTHNLSADPDLQMPGNGAEGALPQALPGLLLLSLKWASLYSSVCIIQD